MKKLFLYTGLLITLVWAYGCDTTSSDTGSALEELLPNNTFYWNHPEADTAYGKIEFGDLNTSATITFHPFPCGEESGSGDPYTFDYKIINDQAFMAEGDTSEVVEYTDSSFDIKETDGQGTVHFDMDCSNLK
jgi:hypothetical protein